MCRSDASSWPDGPVARLGWVRADLIMHHISRAAPGPRRPGLLTSWLDSRSTVVIKVTSRLSLMWPADCRGLHIRFHCPHTRGESSIKLGAARITPRVRQIAPGPWCVLTALVRAVVPSAPSVPGWSPRLGVAKHDPRAALVGHHRAFSSAVIWTSSLCRLAAIISEVAFGSVFRERA